MKKYSANTVISVSVTLPKGGNTRVSFSALTDGTSVYYTDDKDIQWALEHHYKYGKLFCLIDEQSAGNVPTTGRSSKKAIKPTKKEDREETPAETTGETETMSEDESREGVPTLKEVSVSDFDDAKDYLAENFGIVRTKLKSKEQIDESAADHGIKFNYTL
ncbi:MAG: hypothetical protein NC411_10470 [Bacteroides sp.]|nr:hypothetical protein [Bacteroides sp.]